MVALVIMPYEIDIGILSSSLSMSFSVSLPSPHISLSSGKWNSNKLITETIINQSCLIPLLLVYFSPFKKLLSGPRCSEVLEKKVEKVDVYWTSSRGILASHHKSCPRVPSSSQHTYPWHPLLEAPFQSA